MGTLCGTAAVVLTNTGFGLFRTSRSAIFIAAPWIADFREGSTFETWERGVRPIYAIKSRPRGSNSGAERNPAQFVSRGRAQVHIPLLCRQVAHCGPPFRSLNPYAVASPCDIKVFVSKR